MRNCLVELIHTPALAKGGRVCAIVQGVQRGLLQGEPYESIAATHNTITSIGYGSPLEICVNALKAKTTLQIVELDADYLCLLRDEAKAAPTEDARVRILKQAMHHAESAGEWHTAAYFADRAADKQRRMLYHALSRLLQ